MTYLLSVDYPALSRTYRKEFAVLKRIYDAHPEGSRIEVRHMPGDPRVSMVGDSLSSDVEMIAASGGIFLFGVVLFARWRCQARRLSDSQTIAPDNAAARGRGKRQGLLKRCARCSRMVLPTAESVCPSCGDELSRIDDGEAGMAIRGPSSGSPIEQGGSRVRSLMRRCEPCGRKVLPNRDGSCPSCGRNLEA